MFYRLYEVRKRAGQKDYLAVLETASRNEPPNSYYRILLFAESIESISGDKTSNPVAIEKQIRSVCSRFGNQSSRIVLKVAYEPAICDYLLPSWRSVTQGIAPYNAALSLATNRTLKKSCDSIIEVLEERNKFDVAVAVGKCLVQIGVYYGDVYKGAIEEESRNVTFSVFHINAVLIGSQGYSVLIRCYEKLENYQSVRMATEERAAFLTAMNTLRESVYNSTVANETDFYEKI